MNSQTLEHTRLALHGVAELVLAGPQYAASRQIRLQVTEGGFGTVTSPELRVDGLELVTPTARLPLGGTFAGLARAAGVEARPLGDVYAGGPDLVPADPIVLEPGAAAEVLDALARGDAALGAFAPELDPVLWPEHFDVAITRNEVNYGVSPGDGHLAEPYAYVGPWAARVGPFWNVEFGAARLLGELEGHQALLDFFQQGASLAVTDPSRA